MLKLTDEQCYVRFLFQDWDSGHLSSAPDSALELLGNVGESCFLFTVPWV